MFEAWECSCFHDNVPRGDYLEPGHLLMGLSMGVERINIMVLISLVFNGTFH